MGIILLRLFVTGRIPILGRRGQLEIGVVGIVVIVLEHSDIRQRDGRPVWILDDNAKLAAAFRDKPAQRREQEIARLLESRDVLSVGTKPFTQTGLGPFERLA